MNSERVTSRDDALRGILVTTAAAEGRVRPPRARWALAIAAFAVAGALTGAAITTSAIASADQSNRVLRLGAAAEQQQKSLGNLVGYPVVKDTSGTAHLLLGNGPASATRVVVAFECFDSGKVRVNVGKDSVESDCNVNSPRVVELTSPTTAPQTVTVEAGSGRRVLAWASWFHLRPIPSSSAQQDAELADGKVTHAEYLAAYNRYAGCMAGAGYPMTPVDGTPPFVFYAVTSAAVDSGADNTCNNREFAKVDASWQAALSRINVRCLAARRIDGSRMTLEDQLSQLHRLGLTLESCQPEQH